MANEFFYSKYHIMPQVMRSKLTAITMLLNTTPMVRDFIDTLFENSYRADFGTRTKVFDDREYQIQNTMWGNQVISSGKRLDARVERIIEARSELDGLEPVQGTVIEKNNPKNITYYEKRAWDLDYPLVETGYQQFPDPVTGEKLIDIDLWGTRDGKRVEGNLFTHDEALAKKLDAKMELIKTHNLGNKLVPKMQVAQIAEETIGIARELSDIVLANIGLPKKTRTFFSGGGIHIIMPYNDEKIKKLKKDDMVCNSNSFRGWIRLPGATNLSKHMQCSFPLFGWDKFGVPIEKAYALANPCFFILPTGARISRKFNDFLTGQPKETSIELKHVLYKYHRSTVPSSSLTEEYTKGYLKTFHPELYVKELELNENVFGRGLDKGLRWKIIRKIQAQQSLSYNELANLAGVRI